MDYISNEKKQLTILSVGVGAPKAIPGPVPITETGALYGKNPTRLMNMMDWGGDKLTMEAVREDDPIPFAPA